MNLDPNLIWIAAGVIVLLAIVGLFARGSRRARTDSLRDKFGSEYDHAVSTAGNRARAENDLVARTKEVEKFDIRPLTAAERERYRIDWQRVEQHFVARPAAAVAEADELVEEIMRLRGYPMADFDTHAAHLSVKHPRVVEHYRAGHGVIGGAAGSSSTEDLRQGMLHYRALFDELIGIGAGDVESTVPRTSELLTREEERERRLQSEERPDISR
jgi:hypothetical protein